ncbi:hypothetical protein LP419_21395 [Massilia sp. H-1]|nr:hypothetical protein LP419_21395 [Massilia sp. H-1]
MLQLINQAGLTVARYLIVLMLAALVACTYSASNEQRAAAFPETRSAEVQVSEVRDPARYVAPGAAHGLLQFAQHASVTDGERARVRDFELLYHAPNRHPGVAAPLPA